MERVKILNLITLALTFLALAPKMECQVMPQSLSLAQPPPPPRPLCASQFALVNYACGSLPFTPGPPPSPNTPETPLFPSSPNGEEGHQSHHRHGGHSHRHRHQATPQEDNCCRWAREMDSQCVCEILVRLPPFLIRPLHRYSLVIGDFCDVTYSCGAPI